MYRYRFVFVILILMLSFGLAGVALTAARAAQSSTQASQPSITPQQPETSMDVPVISRQDVSMPAETGPEDNTPEFDRFSPRSWPFGERFALPEPGLSSGGASNLGGGDPISERLAPMAADSNPPLPGDTDFVVCMSTDRVWGLVDPGETVTVSVDSQQMGASLANHIGYFWTTLYDGDGNRPGLGAGDGVAIYHDSALEADITLRSIQGQINPLDETVTGTIGGGGFPISVTVYIPLSEPSLVSYSQTVSTDGSGNFVADFSADYDLWTWDEAIVGYVDDGVEVHRHVYPTPGLMVRPWPYNWVFGVASAGNPVTVSVYLSDNVSLKVEDTVLADTNTGFFFSTLLTDVMESDIVYAQLDGGVVMSRTVDRLTMWLDAENDRITGETESNATVRAEFDGLTPLGSKLHKLETTADASGVYTIELGSLVDIMPGQTASVLVADDEGDELNMRAYAPNIIVHQTWDEVYGRAASQSGEDLKDQPVTITIFSAESEAINQFTTHMDFSGYYEFTGKEFEMPDIVPGDLLTVNTAIDDWQGVVAVKPITVEADLDNDLYTGEVEEPSDRVELHGNNWYSQLYPLGGYFDLVTFASSPFTAEPVGFDVDYSQAYELSHRNEDGYVNRVYHETGGFGVLLQDNTVVANLPPAGSAFTITLSNSSMDFKAQLTGVSNTPTGDTGWQSFWSTGEVILSGDWIQVQSSAGYSQSMQIPDLFVNADADTEVISGQAPPNTLLVVNAEKDGDGFVPTDDEGNFKVGLNELQETWGDGNIRPGNNVWIWYYDSNRNWVIENALWQRMRVNYAHDWVGGDYEAGHTFWITVTDGLGDFKATASMDSDFGGGWGAPGFETTGENWSPEQPDIQEGDLITITSDDSYTNVIEVGTISGTLDVENNTVSGTIEAGWFTETLVVHCEVWVDNGPDAIDTSAEPDGGNYLCDFDDVGWDLQPGQDVAVWYIEPDGDIVINVFRELQVGMRVNYAHDWAGGNYAAGHTFWITVTDSLGDFVASATINSQEGGGWDGDAGFQTNGEDWSPEQPDIQPGDLITFTADDDYTNVIRVGTIEGELDLENDTVNGTINAAWFTQTLDVHCDVWVEDGPGGVDTTAGPDGRDYTCDLKEIGWDLQPEQDVAVWYVEPDGDLVINVFRAIAPFMRVNYSHDWVGGNYEPGHTFWITVTNSSGVIKGKASLDSTQGGGWGDPGFETQEGDWILDTPDIQVGDWVYIGGDDDYTNAIQVGSISENVDFNNDVLTGTVDADWFTGTLDVRCEVWVDDGPGIDTSAEPDGGEYTCDFGNEAGYDLQPGEDIMARYIEPDGDTVLNVYPFSKPNLRVEKSADGSPAEGGNMAFRIRYANDDRGQAENVMLTDTLEGMSYLGNSYGFDVVTGTIAGGENVVIDLGTLPADSFKVFYLYAQVNAGESERVTNTVHLTTSDAYEEGDPSELEAEWSGEVIANEADLTIDKGSWTGSPTPGTDFVYSINVCNSGGTHSTEIVLTDTLPVSTSLVTWWGQHPGWTEVLSSTHQLVLSVPSLGANRCNEIYLQVALDSGTSDSDPFVNHAAIYSDSDVNPDGNEADYELYAGSPRDYTARDLSLVKGWSWGKLVPGGEVTYEFDYHNEGNTPADDVRITSTLPEHTTYLDAYFEDEYNRQPVTPSLVTANIVVWDVGSLGEGMWGRISLHLDIDWLASPGDVLTHSVQINTLPREYNTEDNRIEWVDVLNDYGPNLKVDKQTYNWNGDGQIEDEIHLINLGSERLESFWITDTYPISTTFNDEWWVGHGVDVSFDHNPANRQLIWQVDSLDPGATGNLIYHVDLDGPYSGQQNLSFTNQVEAPIPDDVNPEDNSDQLTMYTGPDVFVEKWISDGEIEPGELVTFTVKFGNGNRSPWHTDTGEGSRITDSLPSEMTYVRATAPWDWDQTWDPSFLDDNQLEWGWGTMWADSTWYFELVAQISDTVQGLDVFTNTIEAYSENPDDQDLDWSNNLSQVPMLVVNPRFKVNKVYESSRIAGTPVTYTLTVTNSGNEDATNVILTDTLPSEVTYSSGGSYDSGSHQVSWMIPSLLQYGGETTRQVNGTLACLPGNTVTNQFYQVVTSDQRGFSPYGASVIFDILAPTLAAGFDQSATSISMGDTAYFTSTSTTDGSGLSFDWDFGDGLDGSGETTSHQYTAPGRRTVTLTITDGCSYTDTITSTLSVKMYLYLPVVMKNYASP